MATTDIKVEVKTLSPLALGSGQADVIVDAEVAHEESGLPYFPGRRLKGLLYESALEVTEMLNESGIDSNMKAVLDRMFHKECESDIQLIVGDLHIMPEDEYAVFQAEWTRLQAKYANILTKNRVLDEYTSIRYQTRLENGVAADSSLRNLRVVDDGIMFYGTIRIEGSSEKELLLLSLAARNLVAAGAKRNRGFGNIEVKLDFGADINMKKIQKKYFQ